MTHLTPRELRTLRSGSVGPHAGQAGSQPEVAGRRDGPPGRRAKWLGLKAQKAANSH